MPRFDTLNEHFIDDDGSLLIAGEVFFFEAGTNTAKDTFKDAALSIANTNPIILTGDGKWPFQVWFDGTAQVILTDSQGQQIENTTPLGGIVTTDAFADWNDQIPYSTKDIVIGSDRHYYSSMAGDNIDNDPSTTSGFWMEIWFISDFELTNSYNIDQIVIASDGSLYKSLVNSNLGNDPTSSPTEWVVTADTLPSIEDNGSEIVIEIDSGNRVGINATPVSGRNLTIGDSATDADSAILIASTDAGTCTIEYGDASSNFAGFDEYDHATDIRAWGVATAEQMTLNASGDLAINGNVVVDSGQGMDFSATSDGSGTTTSELLDDYEQGTFTPVLSDGTNNATSSVAIGRYTKIGNRVFIIIRFTKASIVSVSGDTRLTGLPFTSVNVTSMFSTFSAGFATGMVLGVGENVAGYVGPNESHLTLTTWDLAGGVSNLQAPAWSTSGTLAIAGSYEV